MEDKKYIVYVHENKINGKVYVGITSHSNPKKRWLNGRGYKGAKFYRAIQKYGWNNFNHIILFENLPAERAFDIEKRLIRELKAQDDNFGYNVADGGQSVVNQQMMVGLKQCRESQKRKVILLNTLDVFSSVADAEKCTLVPNGNIIKVCKGVRSTAGIMKDGTRMVWRYYDETENYSNAADIVDMCQTKRIKNIPKTKVVCVTTGEIFQSITDAEKEYKIHNENICKACKGLYDYTGMLADGTPLRWRYYFDYIKLSNEEIETIKNAPIQKRGRKIMCVEDGMKFESLKEAEKYYHLSTYMSIHTQLIGKTKNVYVGENKRPIHFIYIDKEVE